MSDKRISQIEYLDKPWEKSDFFGWHGVGWYFWDETEVYCYGPYSSKLLAELEFDKYGKKLV